MTPEDGNLEAATQAYQDTFGFGLTKENFQPHEWEMIRLAVSGIIEAWLEEADE